MRASDGEPPADNAIMRADTHVAIIGAGLAGLSAARVLSAAGIRTVILEAQDRAGGRVQTVRLVEVAEYSTPRPNALVELGATWFHGTHGNAAFQLAVRAGLVMPADGNVSALPARQQSVLDNSAVFADDAIHIDPSRQVTVIPSATCWPIACAYSEAMLSTDDGAFAPTDTSSIQEFIFNALSYDKLSVIQRAVVHARDAFECSLHGCASTRSVSARLCNQYVELPGDNVSARAPGMSGLIAMLLQELGPSVQVRLNSAVTSVEHDVSGGRENDRPRVRVSLADGGFVDALVAIWTPSVNVTKQACENTVFRPALPRKKISALRARGQDAVEKVFAVLTAPLQHVRSDTCMPVLWDTADAARMGNGWAGGVFGLVYEEGKCTVSFWLSGTAATTFCELDEGKARAQVADLLTVAYRQSVQVASVVRSAWCRNEFVLGGYSYPLAGGREEDVLDLLEPVPSSEEPAICFAGEGTHPRFYSTMHGAVESGVREADRCIAFLDRWHCL